LSDRLRKAGFTVFLHPMTGGKSNKTLEELVHLYDLMERNEFARDSSLIAVGGGVIGDTAGFAASTFLRGIHLIQVPTTVTSQIDSAIGGKVGINFNKTINAIGTYYHPRGVFIDLDFLQELPERDYIAGLAEIIKCAVICDAAFFEYLQKNAERILDRDPSALLHIYRRTIEIKLDHVRGDVQEFQQKRIRLNYGHTIGHAIELATAGREELYRHGEGVSLGMVAASFLAERLFKRDGKLRALHEAILKRYGLPIRVDLKRVGASRDEFIQRCLQHVRKDKKRQAMHVRFILPEAIGRTVVNDAVPAERIREAVAMLCEAPAP